MDVTASLSSPHITVHAPLGSQGDCGQALDGLEARMQHASPVETNADSLVTLSSSAWDRNEEENHQQESYLESSLGTAILRLLTLKDLVALTGIEPVFKP
jgi:hypothetical protein